MEKNKESQANVLNELQTEIKSLKSLLLNRRAPGPGAPGSPVVGGAGSVSAPWNAAYASSQASSNVSSPKAAEESGSVAATGAMSFLNTKASIPAWQLAAQKTLAADTHVSSPAAEGSDAAA
jgi:peroxin-14